MAIEHNPYDTEKLIRLRADQKDPLVAYLVVRTDLDMSVGKVAVQCSHASDMMVLCLKERMRGRAEQWEEHTHLGASWLQCSFRKIVKTAKNKTQFDKLKEELDVFVVKDAGLTELVLAVHDAVAVSVLDTIKFEHGSARMVEPMTETVLCTWPMYKSQTPKRLVRMRLLK